MVFEAFCGIFQTPSIWTSSPDFFRSPRWPTVVGRRGLGSGGDAGSLTPRCSATCESVSETALHYIHSCGHTHCLTHV